MIYSWTAEIKKARNIVGWYTLAASAKGAVPVPTSSTAIVANNTFMINHVSAAMQQQVRLKDVAASIGVVSTLNMVGRTVFVEGAKALSWGTGSWWALAGLSAFGASTAAGQTYVIGLMTIEICKNGGRPVDKDDARELIKHAKKTQADFIQHMKREHSFAGSEKTS